MTVRKRPAAGSRRRARAAVIRPVQARSRETEQRLFDAAAALFAARGLDATGIVDIVRGAGTGIGTFYGRFRDRRTFVEAFCRRYFEAARARAIDVLSADAMPARSMREFAEAYVRYRVDHYQRNRRLLQAVVAHLRTDGSPELRALAARFAGEFRDLVAARVRAQPEFRTEGPSTRDVAIALTLVEAVLKDLYLAGGGGLVSPRLTQQELGRSLVALFMNALG